MRLLRRSSDRDPDTAVANSLRRYVVARAAGRTAHEYARRDTIDNVGVWIGCTKEEAQPLDGKHFRRIRMPGQPWCTYLGRDISIAADTNLQAFFEVVEGQADAWSIMKFEVSRNRLRALHDYRRRGREILASLRRKGESPGTGQAPELLVKYASKGRGVR